MSKAQKLKPKKKPITSPLKQAGKAIGIFITQLWNTQENHLILPVDSQKNALAPAFEGGLTADEADDLRAGLASELPAGTCDEDIDSILRGSMAIIGGAYSITSTLKAIRK